MPRLALLLPFVLLGCAAPPADRLAWDRATTYAQVDAVAFRATPGTLTIENTGRTHVRCREAAFHLDGRPVPVAAFDLPPGAVAAFDLDAGRLEIPGEFLRLTRGPVRVLIP